jgi:hypothetical protein
MVLPAVCLACANTLVTALFQKKKQKKQLLFVCGDGTSGGLPGLRQHFSGRSFLKEKIKNKLLFVCRDGISGGLRVPQAFFTKSSSTTSHTHTSSSYFYSPEQA